MTCRTVLSAWILTALPLLAATGCRAPWMRSQNSDPTFQHLLDAEREDARVQSRRPAMARSRPGDAHGSFANGDADYSREPTHRLASRDSLSTQESTEYLEHHTSTGRTEFAEVLSADEARDLEAFGRDYGEAREDLVRRTLMAAQTLQLDTPEPPPEPSADSTVKMSFSDRAGLGRVARSAGSYDGEPSHDRPERIASRPAQGELRDTDDPISYAQYSNSPPNGTRYGDTRRRTGVRTFELRESDVHAYGSAPDRSVSYDAPERRSKAEVIRSDLVESELHTASNKAQHGDTLPRDESEQWGDAGDLRTVSLQHRTSDNWRDLIRTAIEVIDAEAMDTTSPERKAELERNSRLLSMMLGDLSLAMTPIESSTAQVQEYLQYTIQALSDITDSEGHPEIRKRATLALQNQRKATQRLADASELEVGNATFCTSVESFADIEEFGEFRFTAGQEVLLYCEVDNFVSLPVPDGKSHETHLRGSYKIVRRDSGAPVESQTLKGDRHVSKAARRDYFMVYRIWMPEPIEPGEYDLRLTIEDVNGRKYGQANIEFEITP